MMLDSFRSKQAAVGFGLQKKKKKIGAISRLDERLLAS
jgi:hypothetical protein